MIRPFTRTDTPALLQLWEGLMANGQAHDPRWQPSEGATRWMRDVAIDLLAQRKPFPHALVWEEDGAVVGFVTGFPDPGSPILVQPPTLRIGDLFVAEGHRRKGIARALVQALKGHALQAGFTEAVVETLVLDERAVAFWQSQGFAPMRIALRQSLTS